jgi:hypothetical protein
MAEPAGRTLILVNRRLHEVMTTSALDRVRLEGSAAWWGSLSFLGGSLLVLGAFVGANAGTAAAVGGVMLFFATAVLAGAEQYEFATALGVSALIWTSAGIAVYLGTDPTSFGSFLALTILGLAVLVTGGLGTLRKRPRGIPRPDPTP